VFLTMPGRPVSLAGAIAPATAPRCPHASRGPKAPGQRPPRPRRALPARRVGRWPLLVRVARVLVAAFRAGGGNACVSCSRPEGGGTAPLPWQGPSPLPQCPADPWSAGGPKPPASARPAPDGRFSPARSGAGLCWCGWHGSWWQRTARAGKRGAFPPPRGAVFLTMGDAQSLWHGPSPLPQRPADPWPAGGQSPRPAPAPPPAGAGFWRTCGGGPLVTEAAVPDREDFPARQAMGLLFQHPDQSRVERSPVLNPEHHLGLAATGRSIIGFRRDIRCPHCRNAAN
jgi:hypothetical protein